MLYDEVKSENVAMRSEDARDPIPEGSSRDISRQIDQALIEQFEFIGVLARLLEPGLHPQGEGSVLLGDAHPSPILSPLNERLEAIGARVRENTILLRNLADRVRL